MSLEQLRMQEINSNTEQEKKIVENDQSIVEKREAEPVEVRKDAKTEEDGPPADILLRENLILMHKSRSYYYYARKEGKPTERPNYASSDAIWRTEDRKLFVVGDKIRWFSEKSEIQEGEGVIAGLGSVGDAEAIVRGDDRVVFRKRVRFCRVEPREEKKRTVSDIPIEFLRKCAAEWGSESPVEKQKVEEINLAKENKRLKKENEENLKFMLKDKREKESLIKSLEKEIEAKKKNIERKEEQIKNQKAENNQLKRKAEENTQTIPEKKPKVAPKEDSPRHVDKCPAEPQSSPITPIIPQQYVPSFPTAQPSPYSPQFLPPQFPQYFPFALYQPPQCFAPQPR